ncbi:MAG TPA: hypothetical protein PKE26_04250 [Kiritimatiellia bacterium]|nr:hypothetical protein [Kiritimatiellia bacterium]HMO98300.1 hypothetical protein [Kiritimatiellia bacterium]HMP95504.1 hypothetical protein [Kiritimatiellia bacterium]
MKKSKTQQPAVASLPVKAANWPEMTGEHWRVLVFLLALGAGLRLLFLGRCRLWQDEMGFISLANPQAGLGDLARQSWDWILSIGQQPLGFMLQNIYMRMIAGWVPDVMYNPFWARMHWLFWGVAAIAGVYVLVRTLSQENTARCSAFLFAISFYPIFYSREVYPYAGVMAAAAFSMAFAYRHVFYSTRPWRWAAAGGGAALVMVYLHLNGVLFYVVMSVVLGISWLYGMMRNRMGARPPWVRQATTLVLSLVLVGLAVSPYVLRFVFLNEAHTQGSTHSLWIILQDPVAKFFLGESMPLILIGWSILLAGMIAVMLRKSEEAFPARLALVTALLAWLLIGLSTSRSQYLSARYFAPLAPLFFWMFAEGLFAAGRMFKRPGLARGFTIWLVGLYAMLHLGFYLPGLYRLDDKDVGFGKIADWLNQNLAPGTPYLMESAYELRWVGGYHPTPGLVGAAPYVHGSGPGEVARLHQRQIQFMQRFPEAPFIESAHHNWDAPDGIWSWPREFHDRHIQLRNDPLRSLVAKGIFPIEPFERVRDHSFVTDIYYSTWDDIAGRAVQQGQPIVFEFPGWTVVPIAQGEYRRVFPGNTGTIELRRMITLDRPFRVIITGVIAGASPGDAAVTVSLDDQPPVRAGTRIGERFNLALAVSPYAEERKAMRITVASSTPVQGFILEQLAVED